MTGVHASHLENSRLYVRLVAAPSQGAAKTGDDIKDVIMNALRKLPGGGVSGARLRSSLVSVGGDGAEVRGGPGARHSSSAAADKRYQTVFPGAELVLTDWGALHRSEIAGRRAVRKIGLCMEMFDVG